MHAVISSAVVATLILDSELEAHQSTTPLWELGMSSISAVALSTHLESALGLSLPATLAFDYPSISAIASYLTGNAAGPAAVLKSGAESDVAALPLRTLRTLSPGISAKQPVLITSFDSTVPTHGAGSSAPASWRFVAPADIVTPISSARWLSPDFMAAATLGASELELRFCGMLPGVELFDAAVFSVTRQEAELMDPQQRLLLHDTFSALAQVPGKVTARFSVFVGISTMEYAMRAEKELAAYVATGNAHSVACGRLSFLYGLQGPSVAVDTACSSSLVVTHLLKEALELKADGSAMADSGLAASVNLILRREANVMFSRAGMLTADGRCKTLDAAADGYGRLEAAGVLTAERAHEASSGGALARIASSTVNQDGRSSSLTAPNGPSQQRLVADALAISCVSSGDVTSLQLHGTGTPLGDPIEIGAACAVLFREPACARDVPLVLAASKSAFGHGETAAGMVGLAQALFGLQLRGIPPVIHLRQLNPYTVVHLEAACPGVCASRQLAGMATPIVVDDKNVVVGTSSFAFQGTNAHSSYCRRTRAEPLPNGPLLDLGGWPTLALAAAAPFCTRVSDRWTDRLSGMWLFA